MDGRIDMQTIPCGSYVPESAEREIVRNNQSRVRNFLCLGFALLAISAVSAPHASAEPAWLVDGVWWNNMCRAGSGAWWLYPVQYAQPVGTSCTIASTGEVGVVTIR
jgi:hypothetical protein